MKAELCSYQCAMRLASSSRIFLERSLMDVTERKILLTSVLLKHLALELEFSSRNITDICASRRFTYCLRYSKRTYEYSTLNKILQSQCCNYCDYNLLTFLNSQDFYMEFFYFGRRFLNFRSFLKFKHFQNHSKTTLNFSIFKSFNLSLSLLLNK